MANQDYNENLEENEEPTTGEKGGQASQDDMESDNLTDVDSEDQNAM